MAIMCNNEKREDKVKSSIVAALALSVALVAPHLARAGEIDNTVAWYKKPDALATCIREMRVEIEKQFGGADVYKAEEWCNTDINFMKCIKAASDENKDDVIRHVRSLPRCVETPLPSNIAFDDIAQWVADQKAKELNKIILVPTIATASPK
jgi:hypothetical protein